jgi:hypothetical protein
MAPVRTSAPSMSQTDPTDVDKQVRLSPDLCYCFLDGPGPAVLKAFSYNTSNTSSSNTSIANPNLAVRKKPDFPPSPVSNHTALWR